MYLEKIIVMKAQKGMLQADSVALSSPAGWLLDITKLKLGTSIGEGEFGGELSLVYPPHYELIFVPWPTLVYNEEELCLVSKDVHPCVSPPQLSMKASILARGWQSRPLNVMSQLRPSCRKPQWWREFKAVFTFCKKPLTSHAWTIKTTTLSFCLTRTEIFLSFYFSSI